MEQKKYTFNFQQKSLIGPINAILLGTNMSSSDSLIIDMVDKKIDGGKKIDIKKIDKLALLKALWQGGKYAAYFDKQKDNELPFFDEQLAKEYLDGFVEYFCGKCIRVDFSKDTIDSAGYNKANGQDALESVIRCMKCTETIIAQKPPCQFKPVEKIPMMQGVKCGKHRKEHKQVKSDDVPTKKQKTRDMCIFKPFGEPMLQDDPGTVLCSFCGHFKKHHVQ